MSSEPSNEKGSETARVPRVSVICIFFQAEEHLCEAIDSVLAQTFDDFELLLVDDGSTDGSTAIAKDYERRNTDRIRYLEHPRHANRGMSATRNLGLSRAIGQYVAFIDADDRWRATKLEEQVALLDALPDVDAVCGAVNYWASHDGGTDEIIPTGHAFNRAVRPPEALLNLYPLGRADPPCPSDLLIRREMIDAIGGFEESFTGPMQLYEDQAFLTKFYLEGTIYFDERVWLDYRLHNYSCTSWVHSQGLRPEVRRRYLDWFENYLAGTPHRFNLRIRLALIRALRPFRHPHLSAFGRRLKSLFRQLRPARAAERA